MGPPPFRELVLKDGQTGCHLKSPLGADAFDDVLSLLAEYLPEDVLDVNMAAEFPVH